MTSTKHTPGPWFYDGDGFDSLADADCGTDGYEVFTKDEHGDVNQPVCSLADTCDENETEANANLIAASPDLLQALEKLLAQCEKIEEARCQSFYDCDEARAAIAKALGGVQS